jgi:hypothetical protein
MARIFESGRQWIAWYWVLRCRKGFKFFDSVRYGLWFAQS